MAPDCAAAELARVALGRRVTVRLKLGGSSMFPAVRPGDIATIRCGPDLPSRGDIVLYVRDGCCFAHRVIRFEGGRPVTQGDTLPAPDGPVAEDELLGRIVLIQRGRRCFVPPRTPPAWERAVAALCRRSGFFHRLVMLLWAAWRKVSTSSEEGH